MSPRSARRRCAALSALLVCVGLLSACRDAAGPAVGPSAVAGRPSGSELDRVGALANLRRSDLPGFADAPAPRLGGDAAFERANVTFSTCLGLSDLFGPDSLSSAAFASAPDVPFTTWSSQLSRHRDGEAAVAVRAFAGTRGAVCLKPLIEQLLRGSLRAQSSQTTASGVTTSSLPAPPSSAQAVGAARARVEFFGPLGSRSYTYDLVLIAQGDFVLSLSGSAFNELPSATRLKGLTTLLSRRLVAAVQAP